jgi:hypothetical protein
LSAAVVVDMRGHSLPRETPSVFGFECGRSFGALGIVILDILRFVCVSAPVQWYKLTDNDPQPFNVKQRACRFLRRSLLLWPGDKRIRIIGIVIAICEGFHVGCGAMLGREGLESGDDDIVALKELPDW